MPTVADYAVLNDGPFELGAGDSFTLPPFFRPDNFVVGTNRAKTILAFKCRPNISQPTGIGVTFTVTKGVPPEQIIGPTSLNTGTVHGFWEAFPATGFGQNVATPIHFNVELGSAVFSDVILWYQVSV